MSSYDEHLISMAGGDGDPLDAIAAKSWDAIIDGAEPWAGQDAETIRIHTETVKAVLNAADPEYVDSYMRSDAIVRTQQATLAAVLNLANTSGRCGWRISADELRKTLRGES